MKCISIKQPWAWLIAAGHKDIENRDWFTRYRGPVLIHAGKYVPSNEELFYIKREFGIIVPRSKLQFGGIIGISEIVDCVENHTSRWFFGAFGFVLRNSKVLNFMPMPGKLGLFEVPFENLNQGPSVNVPVIGESKLL